MFDRELDRLSDSFDRQAEFMQLLHEKGKMPSWPVDITTKEGQKIIKDVLFCVIEELMEASFTLKNKTHRLTDAKEVDFEHFQEELGDAFAYFMEVCILSGIDEYVLYNQFCKKNRIVRQRLENGY